MPLVRCAHGSAGLPSLRNRCWSICGSRRSAGRQGAPRRPAVQVVRTALTGPTTRPGALGITPILAALHVGQARSPWLPRRPAQRPRTSPERGCRPIGSRLRGRDHRRGAGARRRRGSRLHRALRRPADRRPAGARGRDPERRLDLLDPDLRVALEVARVTRSWRATRPSARPRVDHERAGVRVRELVLPVDRAGCYVPGGRARTLHSVLMTALPAAVAGVPSVVLCVPPADRARSRRHPGRRVSRRGRRGLPRWWRAGDRRDGVRHGDDRARRRDRRPRQRVRCGGEAPGRGTVGIDGYRGPVRGRGRRRRHRRPRCAAADLLAQAEHGPGGAPRSSPGASRSPTRSSAALEAMPAGAARPRRSAGNSRAVGASILVDDAEHALEACNTRSRRSTWS